jgi:hypothetical protein
VALLFALYLLARFASLYDSSVLFERYVSSGCAERRKWIKEPDPEVRVSQLSS